YGIAMEYAKFNPVEADKYFSILLNDFPDYLPVYYQAALFYHERMDSDKALDLIKKGITVAQKQQQQKTLTELKNLEMTIMYDE
ncbi:MAG: tetratricopeptide repeat protein, partial [Cyclobacteriaceae bacterium]|nr:tetratricopeptide repeat protein [Cyclobacteriaceae bacterium]